MAVRKETIILELENNVDGPALSGAASLTTLNQAIDALGSHSTSVNRNLGTMNKRAESLAASMAKANKSIGLTNTNLDSMSSRGLVRFSSQADKATASIDKFSGRMGLLGTAAMALGPSLIPLGAAAVPAISSIAAGMGAAAGAAGVLLLAFQGVGDAVTAVSDYQLEPTAENLAKVQEEMKKLGPAGASFVTAIGRALPALRDLQMTAREGIFPGLEQGLNTIMTQLPGVQNLVADLSATVGRLGAASADALVNDADWQEFFAHIGSDGASALETFGRATGNFVAGIANVLEALTGITGGSGLADTSRAFREWAANLEHTEGFKQFADYVRQSGPQVADFLASTGKAMVALIEAAAPWGAVVLPALTALANAFTAIAGSPVGPPLFAAAAAMLAVNKAAALMGPNLARAQTSITGFGTSLRQTGADLKTVTGGWVLASSAADAESKKYVAAQGRLKSMAVEAGKTGPALAAMGLMATGTADKIGLSNTAMLTMAGSMAGPWGAAVGAGVGLTMDLAAANEELRASVEAADQAISSGSVETITKQLADLQKQYDKINTSDASTFGERIGDIFSIDANMAARTGDGAKVAKMIEQLKDAKAAAEQLGDAITLVSQTPAELATSLTSAFDPAQGLIGAQDQMTSTLHNLEGQLNATNKTLVGNSDAAIQNRAAISAGVDGIQALNAAQGEAKVGAGEMAMTLNSQRQALIDSGVAAGLSRGQVTALVNEMGLTPAVVRTAFEAAGIDGVSAKTQGLIAKFHSLPPRVQTHIQANGIPTTIGQVNALVAKYHLTEKERRALISLMDHATPKLNQIISTIGRVKGKTVEVKVDSGSAISNVAAVQAVINSLHGKTVTVTTLQKTIYGASKQSQINRDQYGSNAIGGFYSGGIRAFADGGYGMDGRYYSRQPMLIPGGANILWGEKETGWEAYISGKPGERERNLQILSMAADRLGAEVTAFAKGGTKVYGAPSRPAPLPKAGGRETRAYGFRNDHTARGWALISRGLGNTVKALDRHAKRMEKSLKAAEKAVDKAKDRLDYWNNRRDEVKKAVTGSLTRDWFKSDNTDPFAGGLQGGTAAFAQQQWRKQIADSKKLQATVANLRKNGAGDRFIEEILKSEDPLAAATMFNQQSKAGMRASQSLFLQARYATNAAANSTSAIFADEQRVANKHLANLNSRVKGLEKAINRNHKQAEATRKKNSAAKAASKGARAKKR